MDLVSYFRGLPHKITRRHLDFMTEYTAPDRAAFHENSRILQAKLKDFRSHPSLDKPRCSKLSEIFNYNLCIGEHHFEIISKRFLCENMDSFKAQGYEILFLEHLIYDSYIQDLLDLYFFHDDPEAQMQLEVLIKIIEIECFNRDRDQTFNYLSIIKAAKKAGIRCVAIDSAEAYYTSGSSDRIGALNLEAKEIIEKESQGKKWIAHVGNAHMSPLEGFQGLSNILPRTLAIDFHTMRYETVPSISLHPSKPRRLKKYFCYEPEFLLHRDVEICAPDKLPLTMSESFLKGESAEMFLT